MASDESLAALKILMIALVTVAVFINPSQNRSFEYDTLSNQYARFIKEDPTLSKWPGLLQKMQSGNSISLVTVS